MSIDVKWLLYKYHQLIEARKNAEKLIAHYNKRTEQYGDVNWFLKGKGGLPRSSTEITVLKDYEAVEQLVILESYLSDINILVDSIESAWRTLNHEQQNIIKLRYFEDMSVDRVAEELHFDMRKYYRVHAIAMEGMNICLSVTCQIVKAEDILNRLSPKKERQRRTPQTA